MAPYMNITTNVTTAGLVNGTILYNITDNNAPVADSETNTAVWIFICVFGSVLGVALATFQYCWDRRNLPEIQKQRKQRSLVEQKKKEEKAIAAIKKEPIQVDQFLQKLRQKKLDKYLNFEVRAIVRNQEEYPCTLALHPDNVPRNVNQDVLPYDHSCVILTDLPPDGQNSYINASYVLGYHGQREYIATQGPKGRMVPAFWHMVWQEGVLCIVMATGLFENAVQQCDKYWGDVISVHRYVQQGSIHIWLQDVLELSKLIIRTFHIRKEGSDEVRVVKHYEMVGFNDEHTDPGLVLDVRRRVNNYMSTVTGPILVHCRCGGGKTAVFIAVDYCLKQLDVEDFVDIYSTVLHLRKYRKNMVRTLAQYKLIYDTLALHVQAWVTVVPSAQLPAVTQKLALKDPHSNRQGFEKEFQFLQEIVPKIQIGDCASGHRDENRNKSRDIMLLPPERARPYLQTMEMNDPGTDFINAAFVDGYHQDGSFVVTQWPMQGTINDIWRLLYDFKVHSLVVLNESKCSRNYPCFWPKDLDREEKYGPIGVKYVGCQKYPHIIIRAFSIRKKAACLPLVDQGMSSRDSIVLKMFQYTSWHHRDKTPISTKSFLYMMGCIESWQECTSPASPICVMSRDGFSKCGLYCAVSICCDQLHCEKEIDVFNAVRIVKKNRPQLVPTLAEYIYCYNYMALLVDITQDDTPKIVISSPSVIEGEIRHGYELLTGFENVLSPTSEAPSECSSRHSYFTAPSSSDGASDDELLSLKVTNDNSKRASSTSGGHVSQDNGRRKTVPTLPLSLSADGDFHGNKSNRNLPRGGKNAGWENGHLRENGYLVENDRSYRSSDKSGVVAPATPGQIWSPLTDPNHNEEQAEPVKVPLMKTNSTKRHPLSRQNARELVELNPDSSKSSNNVFFSTSVL